jgi:hypothetical protein
VTQLEDARALASTNGAVTATADGHYRIDTLTARELCELPDPPVDDQLLGPLIVRGQRTVIGGATGEGKTSFSLQAVAAVVAEREFLGWTGAGGRALIVDLEQGLRTIKRRLREAGLDDSDRVDYARIPEGLALDQDPGHIEAFAETLAGGYDVVLLDPHYKAHRGDANAERETVDLMRLLDHWRAQHGFALILPAHTRKPLDPKARPTINDIFGSTGLVRGAEVVIGIKLVHTGYSRLFFWKDRDGNDDIPVGGDPWGLIFSREMGFRRDPADGETRDYKAELRARFTDGAWHTLNEWRERKDAHSQGMGQEAAKSALDELVATGEFEFAVGPPTRGKTARCWRQRTDLDAPGHPGSAGSAASLFEGTDLLTQPYIEGRVRVGQSTQPSDLPGAARSVPSPDDEDPGLDDLDFDFGQPT